jgi:hypothetical protein
MYICNIYIYILYMCKEIPVYQQYTIQIYHPETIHIHHRLNTGIRHCCDPRLVTVRGMGPWANGLSQT